MDDYLIQYLNSGNAWVLVGSGPSTQMGYPSWKELAQKAIELVKNETRQSTTKMDATFARNDYASVFDEVQNTVGYPKLLEYLSRSLVAKKNDKIYQLIAKWPVNVYLTTNFDNQLQNSLAALGIAFQTYLNSPDEMGNLVLTTSNLIVKLHGDLRTEQRLILTSKDYRAIAKDKEWEYWRNRMLGVLQIVPLIIVGHSLTDPHIRHLLETAKKGITVNQPICWIAPEVSDKQKREYLEKYRIRVTSYDNQDGTHQHLLPLLDNLSDFIISRIAIKTKHNVISTMDPEVRANEAAAGFYVFSKLSSNKNYHRKRIEILVAALQSALPALRDRAGFTVNDALHLAGWPQDISIPAPLIEDIRRLALDQGLISQTPLGLIVNPNYLNIGAANRTEFQQMSERFVNITKLRIQKDYPIIEENEAELIAKDIQGELIDYFRKGGLSLATTLYASKSKSQKVTVPASIVKFVTESSTKYDVLLNRQAFWKASIDAFVHSENAQRQYLGRVSQGFFGFHHLGIFGEAASERLRVAKETIWLIDSNAQIPTLALGASSHLAFSQTFSELKKLGIRFFTTEKLFEETYRHLLFANMFIKENSTVSHLLPAAAAGQPPYDRSNQFLAGFVNWQAAGKPADWNIYLNDVLGSFDVSRKVVQNALKQYGIEVIPLSSWPGFEPNDYASAEEYTTKLRNIWEEREYQKRWIESEDDLIRKLSPEAEAFVIIKNERLGKYHILKDGVSPASFISDTAIVNLLDDENGRRITWQTDAFIRFAATLVAIPDQQSIEIAFETLVWNVAQSGINVLDDEAVQITFGGAIDQARLPLDHEATRELYDNSLAETYGEPIEQVLNRISPQNQAMAAVQLANQIALVEAERANVAENQVKLKEQELESTQKALSYYRGKGKSKRRTLRPKKKK